MAGVEGGDGAHSLDLVDMPARFDEALAKQSRARRVAEEKQRLGRSKSDMPASDLAARLPRRLVETGARIMNTGEGRAVSVLRGEADCLEHPHGQHPRVAAYWLARSQILSSRSLGEEHYCGHRGTMRENAAIAGPRHRYASAGREPVTKRLQAIRDRLGRRPRNCGAGSG